MENEYHALGKKDEEILKMSSMLEDPAYLLTSSNEVAYSVVAGKCGTCQCSSSRSAGGTCRASSLEMKE